MGLAASLRIKAKGVVVRCTDCETEPLNLARYCESCGREMSLHETQAKEVDASGADDWAPNPNPTSDLRYQSCVGPSLHGDSSPPSHEPSAITYTDPATPQSNAVKESAETQPVKETVSSASMASTA